MLAAADLLRSHALSRGWVAASGLPDETRSGRQILKDFVNGKLLHCEPPPACALSNTELGLTGQNALASKTGHAPSQAGASDTFALQNDQVQAQLNGDARAHSAAEDDSASDLADSSEQDGHASSPQESSADEGQAGVSNGLQVGPSPAHAVMSDADRELMESMGHVQGTSVLRFQKVLVRIMSCNKRNRCCLCFSCKLSFCSKCA